MFLKKNKKALYFLHIPRTGGLFVKRSLEENPGRFYAIDESCPIAGSVDAKAIEQDDLDYIKKDKNIILFSVVRNPFDLLVSWWMTKCQQGSLRQRLPTFSRKVNEVVRTNNNGHIDLNYSKDFELFASSFIFSEVPRDTFQHFQQKLLTFQLFDDNGNCCVDHILRLENLNNDLNELCKKYELRFRPMFAKTDVNGRPLPPGDLRFNVARVGAEQNYRSFYNDTLMWRVKEHFKKECMAYGYNFDGIVSKKIEPNKIKYNPITSEFKIVE